MPRLRTRVLFPALLIAVAPLSAQTPAPATPTPPAAQALVDQAVAAAKAEHKNVLVYFSATWCVWCHRFATFLDSADAGKLMHDNFVVVQLDALESGDKVRLENPGARKLLDKMSGGANTGIPFYFVLDATGKKIADSLIMPGHHNVGHPAQPDEVVAFVKQLGTIAPKMTPAQRNSIRAFLDGMAGRG